MTCSGLRWWACSPCYLLPSYLERQHVLLGSHVGVSLQFRSQAFLHATALNAHLDISHLHCSLLLAA